MRCRTDQTAMNEKNLRPIQTESEAREKGRAGGKASGKARKKKKTMQEAARLILEAQETNPESVELMRELGCLELEEMTVMMSIIAGIIQKAKSGDVKAAEFIYKLTETDDESKLKWERIKLERERIALEKARISQENKEATRIIESWLDDMFSNGDEDTASDVIIYFPEKSKE